MKGSTRLDYVETIQMEASHLQQHAFRPWV